METIDIFPGEDFAFTLDASDSGKLPTGVSVVSATIEAFDTETERVDNTILSSTSALILSNTMSAAGSGTAIPGRKYQLIYEILGSDGRTLKEPVMYNVKKFL